MSAGCPFPGPVRATGRGDCMTTTYPSKPEPGSAEAIEPDEPRKTKGIRFSRSEWAEIKAAAERRDVAAAEFVRTTCLDAARDPTNAGADAILADMAPLIERIFRYVYMLATLRRDELVRDGRGEEVEKLIAAAREVQDRLQDSARK